jgi:hypothetical protein
LGWSCGGVFKQIPVNHGRSISTISFDKQEMITGDVREQPNGVFRFRFEPRSPSGIQFGFRDSDPPLNVLFDCVMNGLLEFD